MKGANKKKYYIYKARWRMKAHKNKAIFFFFFLFYYIEFDLHIFTDMKMKSHFRYVYFLNIQKKIIYVYFITHKVLVVPKFITLILNWNTNNLYTYMTANNICREKKKIAS